LKLIPLNRPELLQAAGLPFETEGQARWANRRASQTGLSAAFVRIGRRVYIDPDIFHELARRGHAAQPAAAYPDKNAVGKSGVTFGGETVDNQNRRDSK